MCCPDGGEVCQFTASVTKVQHMKNYISNNLDTLPCFDNIGGCGDNGIRNEKKGSTKIYFL